MSHHIETWSYSSIYLNFWKVMFCFWKADKKQTLSTGTGEATEDFS